MRMTTVLKLRAQLCSSSRWRGSIGMLQEANDIMLCLFSVFSLLS